ncbi:hypothetical protein Peur_050871 [Populus x canadensis]
MLLVYHRISLLMILASLSESSLFLAFNPRSEVQLLEDVLSHDCNFQDLNFRTPVVGEQNVYIDYVQNAMQFLRKLMKAMGPGTRFKINVTD